MAMRPSKNNQPMIATKETNLILYRQMQLIRQTELALAKAHQRGLVHGACHTYVGQEAIAAGVCHHLRREDVVFSTHRGHGHALAKGMEPEELIAELFGRETGCSQGRGGSMHLFKPEIGMMGTSGIVGPCILQACGGGYSFKLLGRDNVAVAFFGDGAVNNGAFHEGLNMAGIWKLPVLFVCENNHFATEVPFDYSSSNPHVGRRAKQYGMSGVEVDGNNVSEVEQAAKQAIEQARHGGGPTLIECRTYRTRAHAEGMSDFNYRTHEEVERWKERCPIRQLGKALVESGKAEADELKTIEDEIAELVALGQTEAEQAAWPDPGIVTNHVFCEDIQTVPNLPEPGDRETTYVGGTLEALAFEMKRNPAIFVMGEGIGQRGGNFATTLGLYQEHGAKRLCDTPICERGFIGLGCGAAMTGSRPVIDFMFIDFINDAFGEVINQVAKMRYMSSGRLKMPILLRGCIGIGHSAATHHSGNYASIYSHIPGIRVVLPSTPYDAKGLFHHALRCNDPVLFLEHRELMATKGKVPESDYEIPFGQARVACKGSDATVVALSLMVRHTLEATEKLAKEGISVEVVDPRTASPLDFDTILQSVSKTGRLLVVDEAFGPCSLTSEIAAHIAEEGFDELDAPVKRLNGLHTPIPYSPPLEQAIVPNPDAIEAAIRDLLEE